jgi:hypothetical protein
MIIVIDTTVAPAEVRLDNADDFTAFHVAVRGDQRRIPKAVMGIRRADDAEHLYVDCDVVLRLAGDRARSEEWMQSFDGMLEYARSKGWLAHDRAIRAHMRRLR